MIKIIGNDILGMTLNDLEYILEKLEDSDYFNNETDLTGTRNILVFLYESKQNKHINDLITFLECECNIKNDKDFINISDDDINQLILYINDIRCMYHV